MGYISEGEVFPSVELASGQSIGTSYWWDGASRIFTPGSRNQYGYRSTVEGELAFLNRASYKPIVTNYVKERSYIDLVEQIASNTTPNPRGKAGYWGVNDRDYSSGRCSPISFLYASDGPTGRRATFKGYLGAGNVQHMDIPFPWDDTKCRAWAGGALRAAAPQTPTFNLTRFLGELRQAPLLLDPRNYKPRLDSTQHIQKDVGSGFLNLMFGIRPTWSDLNNAAEAVIASDGMVKDFVFDSQRRSHRVRREIVSRETFPFQIETNNTGDRSHSVGPFTFLSNTGGTSVYTRGPTFKGEYSIDQEIRAFTWFQWFVGDPDGYLSRHDSYVESAKKLLGGGLDTATTYELIPFSWLVDWFYDIGSLVRYQQYVADDGLVMHSCGWLNETRVTLYAHPKDPLSPYADNMVLTDVPSLTAHYKRQHRRQGNPYSLAPDWSLNAFQFAIVAALGLTKAPYVPLVRH